MAVQLDSQCLRKTVNLQLYQIMMSTNKATASWISLKILTDPGQKSEFM